MCKRDQNMHVSEPESRIRSFPEERGCWRICIENSSVKH